MDPQQALKQGDLDGSLTALQERVRKSPADPTLRTFFFQLQAVQGQWQKALKQLDVLADLDDKSLAMVQTYRQTLQCEALRSEVFKGLRSPLILGNPPQWIAPLLEALKLDTQGHHQQAHGLRQQALDAAPAIPGQLNEQPFAWLADADSRLGPVVEGIVNGRYYWIPMERIQALAIEAPSDLRDLVWLPATATWSNGGQAVIFIPSRYPDTAEAQDAELRLARRTEWRQVHEGYWGLGQRLLASDQDDYPLLEVRQIDFDLPASEEDPALPADVDHT
ncbi:MAG: type VI secretion system accessory protein TagJ [Candidatus Competibacterales bacterium]